MAMIEVREQCKKCFHFQVCANVLKQQLFIRETMLKQEDVKCEQFISAADVVPRAEYEELIYKLECLLCCASGSKLSKHTYDLKTMETVVNDYINESYYDGAKDTAKEIFHEIFEIIKKYEFDALAAKENYGVFQVRNFGCDIMKLREKYNITDNTHQE